VPDVQENKIMARRRKTVAFVVLLLALVTGGGLFALGWFGVPEFALDREPVAAQKEAPKPAPAKPEGSDLAKALPDLPDLGLGEQGSKGAATNADPNKPSFDIARISRDGTSVFAGRAKPNSIVSLMENGKAVATAKSDENGEWSMSTEHRFASADPKLGLETREATEQDKVAAATPEIQRDEPKRPQYAPEKDGAAASEDPRSPKAATAGMMKNLEGLVAEARKEAEHRQTEEPAKAEETAKAEEPAKAEETKTAEDKPAPSATPGAEASAPRDEVKVSEHTPTPPPAAAPQTPPTPGDTPAPAARAPEAAPPQLAAVKPPEAVKIPVPIMFVYREATFTDDGKRAAALLLEYLKLKKFPEISLSGHADERGTEELNYELSKERLEAVEQYLRDGGYTGELHLVPKGKLEPFTGVDRSKFDKEALYQLDRRVELHVTR
jgi:outer membrane protein OmpA-like peptidoglycan-associated protein